MKLTTTLLLSVSLAIQAAENVPLPIKRAWSPAQRVAGLRIFLESLVEVREGSRAEWNRTVCDKG